MATKSVFSGKRGNQRWGVITMNDGLFWAAKNVDGQLKFYRDTKPTPGAAEAVLEQDLSNFVLDEKGVRKMKESELSARTAQMASAAEAARVAEEQKKIEQEAAEAQARIDFAAWDRDTAHWTKHEQLLLAISKPKEMSAEDWAKRFDEEWSELDE
jgi:hypothetical protein